MRTGLALLLLAAAAAADSQHDWKDTLKRVEREQKTYWDDYQGRYSAALITLRQPWRDADAAPTMHTNYVFDFSALRRLYNDYAALEQQKAAADLALADSADPRAFELLLKELFDVAKRTDELDKEIAKARPQQWSYYDQRPAIERHALELRRDGLVAALAKCPNAVEGLAVDGLAQAARKDGKRSITRRVAILDALGRCPDSPAGRAALVAQLAAPESSLRLVAAEALLRLGGEPPAELRALLRDESPVVRRALLQGIATVGAGTPAWIEPVLASYPDSRGVLREDHVRALAALTKQNFGDAPALWKEWFEDYRKEIGEGRFDREKVEVREAKPQEVPTTCTFYGVKSPGLGVIFVLEATRRLDWPADLEFQLTQYKENWQGRKKTWEKEHPCHHAVLEKEFALATGSLPEDAAFGLVGLYGGLQPEELGTRKLLRPERRDLKAAQKWVEKLPADGWGAAYAGLMAAARLAGMDPADDLDFPAPRADTIFLFAAAAPSGGRYMTPEAALAAFVRANRFRRLVVHAIRFCDEGEPSETLLKGLAEATGGTYVWMKKPR